MPHVSLQTLLRSVCPWIQWTTCRRRKAMQAAIEALPEFHQQVFQLLRFENLPITKVAERLHCEPVTVETAFAEVLIALVRSYDG